MCSTSHYIPVCLLQPRLQTCICSIAEDNSVAVLSTSQNKCLLLASCHISPVVSVHWRLEEDFLLVHCSDGRLYVWQIETGKTGFSCHIRLFLFGYGGRGFDPKTPLLCMKPCSMKSMYH